MSEPTKMQCGMPNGVGSRNHVLNGGPDPRTEGQFYGEK